MRKKLNTPIYAIKDLPGQKVTGKIGERKTIVTPNYPDGLETLEFLNKAGEITTVWMDGGLKGLFTMAKLDAGQEVEIEFTGQREFGDDGRKVNTYDAYSL